MRPSFPQAAALLQGKVKLYYYRPMQPNATQCVFITLFALYPCSYQILSSKTTLKPSSSGVTISKAVLGMGF